jgi:hypothetical protein
MNGWPVISHPAIPNGRVYVLNGRQGGKTAWLKDYTDYYLPFAAFEFQSIPKEKAKMYVLWNKSWNTSRKQYVALSGDKFADGFRYVQDVAQAHFFSNVPAALTALQARSIKFGEMGGSFEIVKVETITTPPTREIVRDGPLSLLDGKVVLTTDGSTYGDKPRFFVNGTKDTTYSLDEASAFTGQRPALDALQCEVKKAPANSIINRYLRVVPIREIPGKIEYKETVLQ